MKIALQYEIEQFYYKEAELLDQYKYNDWFALMTKDIEYKMPVRLNKENGDLSYKEVNMYHFLDDYESLKLRVDRLYTNFAWAEDPPSRIRRLITNIQVKNDLGNQIETKSYFILYRSRGSDSIFELITGARQDTLVRVDGQMKIQNRLIHVDQATLNLKNLAVFF